MSVIKLTTDDIYYLKTIKEVINVLQHRNDDGRFTKAITIERKNWRKVIQENTYGP